jgi:hypothetical protein
MSNTVNTLPTFEAYNTRFRPRPLHVMDTDTRVCVLCGDTYTYESYQVYLDSYRENYEGPWLAGPYNPAEENDFEWWASSCRA